MKIAHTLLFLCLGILSLEAIVYDVGRYDNPRNDFTLRIKDPFAQENSDLMQPVIGKYILKVLPGNLPNGNISSKYDCEGLYFKQTGAYIYIDVRKLPKQRRAGLYDLYVSLTVPGEEEIWNRLVRKIRYVDSASDVVLVIDNSRSMRKNDPSNLRYTACENFIQLASLSNKIEQIAVVKFSGSAKVILPWTNAKKAKEMSIKSMLGRSRTGNFTNINEALELSSVLFEDSIANDKILILLTDGKNEPDRYRDTHKYLKELGVRIYTVGLSAQADTQLLKEISRDTDGDFFSAVDDGKLLRIYNQIAQEINDFKPMIDGKAIGEVVLPMVGEDEFVDINLYGYQKGTTFSLIGPNGQQVTLSKIFGELSGSTSLFRLQSPPQGNYVLRASRKDASFSYNIHTLSDLFLKAFPLEKKFLRGEVTHFAASLAIRDKPITGVPVEGIISNAEGIVVDKVTLFDDGVHGDNHANDGVYCAIYPIKLDEGAYSLNLRAEGFYKNGMPFIRTDKQNFYVLQADVENKEFFLASVLPLYIDLGKIEQGGVGSASVRLSFEGLRDRKVSFEITQPFVNASDPAVTFSKNILSLPEVKVMKPSMAEIISFKIKIPKDAALGEFSSLLTIILEDQEINIPVDFKVKKNRVVRQIAQKKTPRTLIPEFIELDSLFEEEDTPQTGLTEPIHLKESKRQALRQSFPESHVVAKEIFIAPPKPIIKFDFDVIPKDDESFVIGLGQEAEAIYTIVNKSSVSGTIYFKHRGVGELELEKIQLEPGEDIDILWHWKVENFDRSPSVELSFSSGNIEHIRSLSWVPPPPKDNTALLATLIMLGFLSVFYGLLYLKRREKSDIFISLSSALHFVIVLYALVYMVAKIPKLEEEELITVEFIEEKIKEEKTPIKEPNKVEEKENPLEVIETLTIPAPSIEVETLATKPKEEATEFELQKNAQVKAERIENKIEEISLDTAEIALQEIEVVPVEQERSSWVMKTDLAKNEEPVVLSLNDRPTRRAILKKRSPRREQSSKIDSPLKNVNEVLVRKTSLVEKQQVKAESITLESEYHAVKTNMKRVQKLKKNPKIRKIQRQLEVDVALDKLESKAKTLEVEKALKLMKKNIEDSNLSQSKKASKIKYSTATKVSKIGLESAEHRRKLKINETKKAENQKIKLERTPLKEANVELSQIQTQEKVENESKAMTVEIAHKNKVQTSVKKVNKAQSKTKLESNKIAKIELKETSEKSNLSIKKLAELKAWDPQSKMVLEKRKATQSTSKVFSVNKKVAGEIEVIQKIEQKAVAKRVEIEKQKNEVLKKSTVALKLKKKTIKYERPSSSRMNMRVKAVKQKNLRKRTSRQTTRKNISEIEPAKIDLSE